MVKSNQKLQALPDPQAFVKWVKWSLADLNMRPSNFLREDDIPGSVNRVGNIIKRPNSLKLETANQLETEIRAAARKKGIKLLPLPHRHSAGGDEC